MDKSYMNNGPNQFYDQEVGESSQHPLPIGAVDNNLFPTVAMFKGKENFSKFDLQTLFFVFYYQPGTYQ